MRPLEGQNNITELYCKARRRQCRLRRKRRNLWRHLPGKSEQCKYILRWAISGAGKASGRYQKGRGVVLRDGQTKDDLELFKLLISVSGIGPKGGLAILSALSADDLRFAVLSGDSKAISKAPGVGAKTAQRVILELKDKMSLEDAFEKKSEHVQNLKISGNGQVRNDAVMALTALGYSSAESLKAVSAVEITEEMDVEAVLKAALKHMSLL